VKVLVDTSVWSAALRRREPREDGVVAVLRELIDQGRAAMVGPIRQELLSGIKHRTQFERLRDVLRAFPDEEIAPGDYERAASHFNTCRRKGVQASNTDFLLCAVAERLGMPILTTDGDFELLRRHVPVRLLGHGRPA